MGLYTVLLVIHSIIVLFLIMMVLIQRTDSDGMGGLGGGGGNQFMTGRATANLLTRTTAILAAAFMVTSLALAVVAGRMTDQSIIDSVKTEETTPADVAKDKAPEETKDKAADDSKKNLPRLTSRKKQRSPLRLPSPPTTTPKAKAKIPNPAQPFLNQNNLWHVLFLLPAALFHP